MAADHCNCRQATFEISADSLLPPSVFRRAALIFDCLAELAVSYFERASHFLDERLSKFG